MRIEESFADPEITRGVIAEMSDDEIVELREAIRDYFITGEGEPTWDETGNYISIAWLAGRAYQQSLDLDWEGVRKVDEIDITLDSEAISEFIKHLMNKGEK